MLKSTLLVILGLFSVWQTVMAAETILPLNDGRAAVVRTGTEMGECEVETVSVLEHGAWVTTSTAFCVDWGTNPISMATATSTRGCGAISGNGLCALTLPQIPPDARYSTQLNCPEGATYNVTTGDNQGGCTTSSDNGGSISCSSDEGSNRVTANCNTGCGGGSGSACCCKDGTNGCGPGNECNN
jgi:hypothetical protein